MKAGIIVWTAAEDVEPDDLPCHLCPGPCCRMNCPHAFLPGIDEEELGAAHEPFDGGE